MLEILRTYPGGSHDIVIPPQPPLPRNLTVYPQEEEEPRKAGQDPDDGIESGNQVIMRVVILRRRGSGCGSNRHLRGCGRRSHRDREGSVVELECWSLRGSAIALWTLIHGTRPVFKLKLAQGPGVIEYRLCRGKKGGKTSNGK